VGTLCVVMKSGMRHRGRVECIKKAEPNGIPKVGRSREDDVVELMVYLIDIGARLWRSPSQVFGLTDLHIAEQLFAEPSFVMQARLSKIKPTVKNLSVWPDESLKKFKAIITANINRFKMQVSCPADR
jgi:hypothetical protein